MLERALKNVLRDYKTGLDLIQNSESYNRADKEAAADEYAAIKKFLELVNEEETRIMGDFNG